ncbi:MAG: HAMP domain-containing protein [Chloroflexi bacterium]|nr:HAMP domain-containing protein [Chloroflexota bacterium]
MISLRSKLVLSHIMPTLLLLPLLSLYLLYTLEDFYTSSLLDQLVQQSQLIRKDMESKLGPFPNAVAAQNFLNEIAPFTFSRVLILDHDATVLASTRLEDASRIGTKLENPSIMQALEGDMATGVGPGYATDVAYVVLPIQRDGVSIGALRLSYEVTDVRTQFDQLRWLIMGGFTFTVLLSVALALGLATTITRPLRLLSEGVQRIATGDYLAHVPVRSRDEVGFLARGFNQMTERLREAEQGRQRQLAAIVHELVRPLAGMHAAIETLRDGADTDREMREALLTGTAEELARFKRMLGTLQSLHQRELHPIRLVLTEIDLQRLIHACANNFEPIAARQQITLTENIQEPLPRVQVDEDRIIQVLTNLLDNAVKFTPRGGSVSIQSGIAKRHIQVRVSDTGVGISPEELPYVFQQFYSGAETRPPEKRGMGLGLTICREIIEAHQGEIQVDSAIGKGTTITFTLPLNNRNIEDTNKP